MKDEDKPKEQLLKELVKLRQQIAELKRSETERIKTEEVLRKPEELYKKLVRTSPDASVVLNSNRSFIEVSKQAVELLGYKSAKELIGKDSLDYLVPEDKKKAILTLQKVLKEELAKDLEFTYIKKDGTRFIGELNVAAIKDTQGKANAIIGNIRDITERKRAEEELRESENLYRTLVKTAPDAAAVLDSKGCIIEVSQRTAELFSYKCAEEMIGKNIFVLLIPEDRRRARATLQKILEKGFAENLEFTYIKRDGTHFIGESNAALIKDDRGKVKAIIGIIRDITERKKADEALKKSKKNLQQEVKSLRRQIQQSQRYPEIIGNSPRIHNVIDLVHQVARTNSTVLIYGETGSGKDLIAKALHYNSPRREAQFVTINCAALPEQLIESELFGYVKGAFTGAVENKKGLFEEADKGTIFLNEIGEMPLKVQAKLLQVLENQQMRRLGQSKSITVDVRIIAASNIDLEEAVNRRQFRKDLFYRLNVFPIKVPSLRERREDIPLLVKHFLDKHCLLMNKRIVNISKEAVDMLCQYSYPGNVRELENIIQRSIIIAKSSTLLPNYLPDKLRGLVSVGARASLAEMEKEMIIDTIHQCKGDLDQAARKLGYSRTTLWRRMKKLSINRPKKFS